ncbi:Plant UBX domain-containing protein 1 [Zea mays]|nr:Plant UBX domain-containing protein 1 [Zea mays]ONM16532.1 Plant UBX domain-containing protein 1 [Zea mays]
MEAEYPHQQAAPSYSTTATVFWPYATRRRKRAEDGSDLSLASDMDLDADAQRAAVRRCDKGCKCVFFGKSQDKLKAVSEELGHEIRVFSSENFALQPSKLPSADHEEGDDFYELQPADYYNLISNRMGELSKMLKTRKMREAELAAQRAKRTKAVMRVRFPDGYILEADFLPSERIHSLVDLLMKVLARPDLPFYLCLLLNADDLKAGPFLREGILSLDGLSLLLKPASQPDDSRMNSSTHQSGASQSDPVPTTNKKPGRPKWLKR